MVQYDQYDGFLVQFDDFPVAFDDFSVKFDDFPIDEIPLFSNYSPCFHKIGYIQKIVYKKNNYLVKSMIEKSVYFYKIGRFFPGQGGRSLVESRSDFRPLFAGVGRSLVKV